LEQANRPVKVLQPALAHIHQRKSQPLLLLILDQGLDSLRDQHLPAGRRRADPRRPVHPQARIPAPGRDRVAGVDTDPHPHLRPGRPRMGRQCPLDLQRAQHRLLGAAERGKERVPLGIDLMPGMGGDSRPDQPPVLTQHLRIPVPQHPDQPRRPLDIGEQERHRPARQPAHLATPPQAAPGGSSLGTGTAIDPPRQPA
jgi:hypothetical protein